MADRRPLLLLSAPDCSPRHPAVVRPGPRRLSLPSAAAAPDHVCAGPRARCLVRDGRLCRPVPPLGLERVAGPARAAPARAVRRRPAPCRLPVRAVHARRRRAHRRLAGRGRALCLDASGRRRQQQHSRRARPGQHPAQRPVPLGLPLGRGPERVPGRPRPRLPVAGDAAAAGRVARGPAAVRPAHRRDARRRGPAQEGDRLPLGPARARVDRPEHGSVLGPLAARELARGRRQAAAAQPRPDHHPQPQRCASLRLPDSLVAPRLTCCFSSLLQDGYEYVHRARAVPRRLPPLLTPTPPLSQSRTSSRLWRKTRQVIDEDSGCIGIDTNRNWVRPVLSAPLRASER